MKKLLIVVALLGASVAYVFVRDTAPEAPGPARAAAGASVSALPVKPDTAAPAAPAPVVRTMGMGRPSGMMMAGLQDGIYTGTAADAFYGTVQVKATITGGRIADVAFLSYPNDRDTSRFINSQAMPMLSREAVVAQSAQVNIVSGATETSLAFRESLAAALAQAN